MDANNPNMMGKACAFKGDKDVEDEHNEFFEIVDYAPSTGMVEIGYDGPNGLRLYVKLQLHELVLKAAAFGRGE